MLLPLENVLLSANDGLVQSDDQIWYHFDKYSWNFLSQKDPVDGEERRKIEARLLKGLADPNKAIPLYGTYHLGISPHIYSYYHLLTDLLPHLINSPKYPVLVPNFMPISYTNFLKKIGFKIKLLPPKIFFVEKLFIPTIEKIDWNNRKVKKIQNFFDKILPQPSTSINQNHKIQKKIYVSRELAKKRHLTNEEEFLPILKKFNFKKVLLEKMSIPKQVKLFRSISHIIAPHGAGLTNVLFSPNDIKILEIRPILKSGNFCFENLFSLNWPNYEILVPPQTDRFFLPIEQLEEVLFRWENEL